MDGDRESLVLCRVIFKKYLVSGSCIGIKKVCFRYDFCKNYSNRYRFSVRNHNDVIIYSGQKYFEK